MTGRDIEKETDLLTGTVIGCAIEVHRELGPGLLESAYEECLAYELKERGISFQRQLELPVSYKGRNIDCNYRMDIYIHNELIVELKTVEKILPVHQAQMLTYLRLSGIETGLLINRGKPPA